MLFLYLIHSILINFNFLNPILVILKSKGIKQTWLAARLGKSYNMVNSYVQNRRQPSIEDLYKISEILEVDVKGLTCK